MSTVSRHGAISLIAWVIATNPYRRFFESLAGRPVAIEIVRAEGVVRKVAYGWRRLMEIDRCEDRDDWCSPVGPSGARSQYDTWGNAI
jgi:hypothetical protein